MGKHSIRRQFSFIFIGVMAGVILLCFLVNSFFLEDYYLLSKKKVIFSAFHSIRKASAENQYDTDEFGEKLNELCNNSNIAVFVMDANSDTRYASENGGERLEMRLLGYIFNLSREPVTVLEEKEEYILQRAGFHQNEYLEMYGRLETGISFIIRTPLESIRESATVANRFWIYIGILGTTVGAFLVWFITARMTKPILSLRNISEKMVHLDFEAKYGEKANNELDLLGENMNLLSETLERSISELKTANNELQRDIEKKEQIDAMRKEFLSNVSHELKTPIALIQGYAEGLRDGISQDPESQKFYCDVIVDEAGKMNDMVQKLLTLNRLEFGNDVVEMERFDVYAMIQNCIQSTDILTKSREIPVRLKERGPQYVWADELKTEEVFMNYFTNAVNHCAGEECFIEVDAEPLDGKVRIKVFNTGLPIPEESLPYLWDKFYKVDKARTREYGGSGIGLSIVKADMEAMNQRFGVENFSNGVLFWFELDAR